MHASCNGLGLLNMFQLVLFSITDPVVLRVIGIVHEAVQSISWSICVRA